MNASMKGNPSGRFLGVNLRQDRVSMADEELAKAINADLHSQPGVIVLRLGRTAQNTSALSDDVIRRIAKINGNRYRVAGRSLYCGDTRIINGLLSSNLITTLTPFRPLNDTTTWAFVADDAAMYKTNCTTVGDWGSDAPTDPTISEGATTQFVLFLGVFTIQYTKVRLVSGAVAYESNPSVAQDLTISSSGGGSMCIGDMEDVAASDPTLNAVGIYRSISNTGVPLLHDYYLIPSDSYCTITQTFEADAGGLLFTQHTQSLVFQWSAREDGISVSGVLTNARSCMAGESSGSGSEDAAGKRGTYLWEISLGYITTQAKHWAKCLAFADSSLGAIIEVDNYAPPVASWAIPYQEHIFFCRDATNPHYLWFSKRFRPEQVPQDQFLEIGNPDDPLQCALPFGGQLAVFARKTKYRILGNIVSGFVPQEAVSPRGTPCPMATIATEMGVLFVARDGIFSTVLAAPDTSFGDAILPMFFGETVNDMAPINWDFANTFSAATYKGRYYFAYADTTSEVPNRIAVFSRDTNHWYHYDHPLNSLYVEEDTDLYLGGGQDGFVYVLENGSTDGGDDIALDVQTKDFQGDSKDIRKLFQHLKVDMNTLGEDVTVKFYVDDVLKRTATVNTTGRTERLIPLPEGTMGHHWRISFTYTGSIRIRLYSCAALYLPMSVA